MTEQTVEHAEAAIDADQSREAESETSETSRLFAIEEILRLPGVTKGQRLLAIELIVSGVSPENHRAALALVSRRRGEPKRPREVVRIGMVAQGDPDRIATLQSQIQAEADQGWYDVLAITPDFAVIEWRDPSKFATIGTAHIRGTVPGLTGPGAVETRDEGDDEAATAEPCQAAQTATDGGSHVIA